MKEIMHTYGALIISAAILVGILALFSNVSYRAAAAFENKEILDDNMQNIAYDKCAYSKADTKAGVIRDIQGYYSGKSVLRYSRVC